jgi:hypothetical protein
VSLVNSGGRGHPYLEVTRDHLGATSAQLGRSIPGTADPGEALESGGPSAKDNTPILGEVGLV